ncbi:hypothetical protein PROFUN_00744 [Planoprotostelium fungivorum]|uniref:Uncharacterized protein n=1 Tax=Planoprotostelium fungivorum TaxID=1890364 RepID=A0A2P6NU85_9EUKA|nr:hypothetical protein PROFUN_00744 [Planoprotostelium fungivorum]
MWVQKIVTLPRHARGCHLVTSDFEKQLSEDLPRFKIGLANLFTSLTVNENYDSDVRKDLETSLNRLVPEDNKLYRHTIEGSDDMPAHVKNVLIGPSITIPITNGRFAFGTWQGIYLCEHRDSGGSRKNVLALTLQLLVQLYNTAVTLFVSPKQHFLSLRVLHQSASSEDPAKFWFLTSLGIELDVGLLVLLVVVEMCTRISRLSWFAPHPYHVIFFLPYDPHWST